MDATDPRYQAYQLAMEAAKAEHDELLPKYKEMRQRIIYLTQLIRACSGLTGLAFEDEYSWISGPTPGGKIR